MSINLTFLKIYEIVLNVDFSFTNCTTNKLSGDYYEVEASSWDE